MSWTRAPLVIAVAALATVALMWTFTARELDELRASQRELVAEVAALRKTPIIDITGSPALGSEDAIVTLVEFSDYECPFCIRHFTQTMPQLLKNYIETGKVRYVFRDFPVDQLHPQAIRAHAAGRCADEQQRFWDMHPRLFGPAGSHTPERLEQLAEAAGLTLDAYRTCVARAETTEAVRRSAAEAQALGANGTPSFFIGLRDRATGQVRVVQAISGAHPYDVFAKAIDAVLKKAG